MDFNEDIYDKIQAYLDKDLSQEETREFEAAMAADEELSREVGLHADMEALLADTPENNLRKSLEKLGAESADDIAGFDWRLLVLIPIFFAIIGFLMFGRESEQKDTYGAKSGVTIPTVDTSSSVSLDSTSTSVTITNPSQKTEKDTAIIKSPETTDISTKTVGSSSGKSGNKTSTTSNAEPQSSSVGKGGLGPIEPTKNEIDTFSPGVQELMIESYSTTIDTNTYASMRAVAPNSIDEVPITRLLSAPPPGNETPFEPDARLDSLVGIDYSAQEDFTLAITHQIPETIWMDKDSIKSRFRSRDYMRKKGFYFAANIQTKDSLHKDRFILTTKENQGHTWGINHSFLEKIGEDTYAIDAASYFPSAEGLYYYEIYDEINERRIFTGKYKVVEEVMMLADLEREMIGGGIDNMTKPSWKFNIKKETDSFNIKSSEKSLAFKFAGSIETKEDLTDKKLVVRIHPDNTTRTVITQPSSDVVDYSEFYPMFYKNDFVVKKKEGDIYKFNFKANYNLEPGVYYFLLQGDVDTEDVYYAKRFVVKEKE